MTLADYRVENVEQGEALQLAWEFVTELRTNRPRWLSLCGESGTGKSHLAKGVLKQARKMGKEVIFAPWVDMLNQMRSGDWEMLEFARDVDVLVIDDIATEHQTSFGLAELYNLIESRIGHWTVITCNLYFEQIGDKIDHRIASRMMRAGNVVFEFRETSDWAKTHPTVAPERPLTKEQKLAQHEKDIAPHYVSLIPQERLDAMLDQLRAKFNMPCQ